MTALSPRELDVARLVARDLPNREIGRRLGLTERTVEKHISNAIGALGCRSRVGLAVWVERQGGRE